MCMACNNRVCVACGRRFGEHRVGDDACPGDEAGTFSPISSFVKRTRKTRATVSPPSEGAPSEGGKEGT